MEKVIGDLGDLNVQSFGNQYVSSSAVKNALNNGILRNLLHAQHENVMNQFDYMRHEKYINPRKVNKLQSRLKNLQFAIDIMDNQVARKMVIKRGRMTRKCFL